MSPASGSDSGHTTPRKTEKRRKPTSDILAGQAACAQIARRRDTLYGSESWGFEVPAAKKPAARSASATSLKNRRFTAKSVPKAGRGCRRPLHGPSLVLRGSGPRPPVTPRFCRHRNGEGSTPSPRDSSSYRAAASVVLSSADALGERVLAQPRGRSCPPVPRGAKRGANVGRCQATSGDNPPWFVQLDGPSGHV